MQSPAAFETFVLLENYYKKIVWCDLDPFYRLFLSSSGFGNLCATI
jgi:hypothetical protein